MIQHRTSRRRFISFAAATVTAPYVITSFSLFGADRPAPSNRIALGAIGFGGDADEQLMQNLASSARHYYYVPQSGDLQKIYEEIAVVVAEYCG